MGLSLKDVESGIVNVGNVLVQGLEKFNQIRKEAAGVVPTPTTVPVAATAGTVQEKLQKSGTVAEQAANAQGNGNGTLILVAILVAVLLWKG